MVMTYIDAQKANEMYDKSHGSFFDRGSADSYYHRPRDPHRGGVGGDSGPRIDAKFESDIQAYHAGYDYNEQFGGKKNWD
jgi:hypothetical protein